MTAHGGRVVAIVGPTAVGKSAAGITVARALGGAVVNADSMQLYRGMDIGTAKLRPEERGGIAHHLLDVWEVREPAHVAAYQRLARDLISQLHEQGVTPVFVGGSGLYLRAALDRLDFPGTDPERRAALEDEAARAGSATLHRQLAQRDPVAADAILPSNTRRIVRALEVIELTGRPFSARPGMQTYRSEYDVTTVGLSTDLAELDRRIAERVDRMWRQGLVEEVRGLLPAGLREGRTASAALGYRQVLAMLDGRTKEDTARAETVRATRRFARRQLSWFRRDPRVRWVDAGHAGDADAAGRILAAAAGG